jgi:hypothetical protein
MAESISDTIRDNAVKPASVSIDGQTVTQHSLRDQIDADVYLRNKSQSVRRTLPIRMAKVNPPGAA